MKLREFTDTYERHHAAATAIAQLLRDSGDPVAERRAKRMTECGTYNYGYECPDCGEYHVIRSSLCRDRLCPNCGWALSKRRYHQTLGALTALDEAVGVRVCHLVLTVRHDKESDLRALLWKLTGGFGRLMRDPLLKPTLGAVRAVELTHGDTHGYHPHIHALVAEPRDAAPLGEPQLQAAWRASIDADYDPQVHYEAAYASSTASGLDEAIGEACKYAIKPDALAGLDARALLAASDALRGIRLTSSTGVVKAQLARQAEAGPEHKQGARCASCGSDARPIPASLWWSYDAEAFDLS